MKTKSKEQLIHEAILNDKEIQRLNKLKRNILNSLSNIRYKTDNDIIEIFQNINHNPKIKRINDSILLRQQQIKQYYEN
jgi:retron-type reverse transcriptase